MALRAQHPPLESGELLRIRVLSAALGDLQGGSLVTWDRSVASAAEAGAMGMPAGAVAGYSMDPIFSAGTSRPFWCRIRPVTVPSASFWKVNWASNSRT